jgi:hypothetical protein
VKENHVPFRAGTVQSDNEQTRLAWGVKSLPWVILTDREHIVRAEGFGLQEIEEKFEHIDGN